MSPTYQEIADILAKNGYDRPLRLQYATEADITVGRPTGSRMTFIRKVLEGRTEYAPYPSPTMIAPSTAGSHPSGE